MKIRNDFVSNSSSTSFIISVDRKVSIDKVASDFLDFFYVNNTELRDILVRLLTNKNYNLAPSCYMSSRLSESNFSETGEMNKKYLQRLLSGFQKVKKDTEKLYNMPNKKLLAHLKKANKLSYELTEEQLATTKEYYKSLIDNMDNQYKLYEALLADIENTAVYRIVTSDNSHDSAILDISDFYRNYDKMKANEYAFQIIEEYDI